MSARAVSRANVASARAPPSRRRRDVGPARVVVARASASAEEMKMLKEATTKLRECAKRGAASTAVDVLVGLGRDGVTPDAFAATACISACVNGRNMELAQKVYDEIFEKAVCDPDEVAVVELAKGYLNADPPGWGRAMQLVNGAKDKYAITLTSVTYNMLLQCCSATNDLMRAEEIVDRMVDEEVRGAQLLLARFLAPGRSQDNNSVEPRLSAWRRMMKQLGALHPSLNLLLV